MSTLQRLLVAILLLSSPTVAETVAHAPHSAHKGLGLERQASQSPQAKAAFPAQIAGRVLRADTGEPLANVLVTLSPSVGTEAKDLSLRTSADGRFVFTGVSPGTYLLVAYLTGFVAQFYGQKKDEVAITCPPSCVSVSSGQTFDAINFRLAPYPLITSMKDDVLDAAYLDERKHIGIDPARFSPDGKHFAFGIAGISTGLDPLQVWIYDLDSRNLRRMPREETNLHLSIRDLAWGEDSTLYVSAETKSGPERPVFLASTSSDTTVISEIPKGVGAESNSQFSVTSERLCRGCSVTLSARRNDGSDSYEIAEINSNFIVDASRSLVLYSKIGHILDGSIVTFDLNTQQSREIPLPVDPLVLLDQVHVGTRQLIAYLTAGSCEPDSAPRGEDDWMKMLLDMHLRRQVIVKRVCFVMLP
jgi:hypothetical protein